MNLGELDGFGDLKFPLLSYVPESSLGSWLCFPEFPSLLVLSSEMHVVSLRKRDGPIFIFIDLVFPVLSCVLKSH